MGREIAAGDHIAGKYRVDRVLGRGGMGIVVAATHMELLEPRAIKVMHPEVAQDPDLAKRFLREAQATARLRSEHAAKVLDVGHLDDGALFLVMEYLEGSDLGAVRKKRGPLPFEEAVLYVLQACDALAEVHAMGIVHRDIKPGNVFLTVANDGSPCIKLLDFGVSKLTTRAAADDMTTTGQMIGTPVYMPPEQMRGQKDIDGRADIWALGVTLYVLVTNRVPFAAGDPVALLSQVLMTRDKPRPPSEIVRSVPRGLDAVILRCLERDRDARPANVAELASLLAPFAPASARPLAERIGRVLASASSDPSKAMEAIHLSISSIPASSGAGEPSTVAGLHVGMTVRPARRALVLSTIAVVALTAGILSLVLLRHGSARRDDRAASASEVDPPAVAAPTVSAAPSVSAAPWVSAAPSVSAAPMVSAVPVVSPASPARPTAEGSSAPVSVSTAISLARAKPLASKGPPVVSSSAAPSRHSF